MTDLLNIGKVAKAALLTVGVDSLEQVALFSKANLQQLHGIGPKALRILEETLQDQGLGFDKGEDLPFQPKFLVMGDLRCNNAPKREIIRDDLLACLADKQREGVVIPDDEQQSLKAALGLSKPISSLYIKSIITHGKKGAVEAVVTDTAGNVIPFAQFYLFESQKKDAKIKAVQLYFKKG